MERINKNQLEELAFHEIYAEEKLIEPLLEVLKSQAATMIPQIKNELALKNYNKVSEVAHSLKASAWQLGLQKMGDLCLILETEGRRNSKFNFEEIIVEIEKELVVGEKEILDYLLIQRGLKRSA